MGYPLTSYDWSIRINLEKSNSILATRTLIQIQFYQVAGIINDGTPLIYPLFTYKRDASHGKMGEIIHALSCW